MSSRVEELEAEARELRAAVAAVREQVERAKAIADRLEAEYLPPVRPELELVKGRGGDA